MNSSNKKNKIYLKKKKVYKQRDRIGSGGGADGGYGGERPSDHLEQEQAVLRKGNAKLYIFS